MNKKIEYTCSHCGDTFKSDRTEEEANKEAKDLWGDLVQDPANTRVVCDTCFEKFYDPRTSTEPFNV